MSDIENDADEAEDKKSPLSRKDFKQALSKFSRADLIKLVGDLYSTSSDNRNFLEAKFSSINSISILVFILCPFIKAIQGYHS